MATLVLTAVGSIVGGPIGALVGAVVGQQIDQAIFRPATRQGPRLTDLAVQTSTYGARVPQLFGSMRVAGTVIWATDLVETRSRQSNGKGRGATDVYSYSSSFAVALSARPIAGIGRIWADGKLLRGSAGDLKTPVQIRVHTGDRDQQPDPLIAATEGLAATPAYRGLAYVVFEGMALADYGNRIPSLSIEVIADATPLAYGAMLGELGDGTVTAGDGPLLGGVAATGETLRGVIEAFGATVPVFATDTLGRAHLRVAPNPVAPPASDDVGAYRGERAAPRATRTIDPLELVPVAASIAYLDGARDYQPGLQRARREGAGAAEARFDLPAVIDAATARSVAEAVLARGITERRRLSLTLPWRAMTLRPGDAFVHEARGWRIALVAFEDMVVRLDLIALAAAQPIQASVDGGRALSEIDAPHGLTTLSVIDLPALDDVPARAAQLAVAANGISPGWRRAALLASVDGGATYVPAGGTALPAVIGVARTVLGDGPTGLVDRRASVEIDLVNASLVLFDADHAALSAGANLAMIGDEAVQFGRAEPLESGRWRLSELWRGRRATEEATGGHGTGERFVLLEARALARLSPELAVPGVVVMASGIGDGEPWPTAMSASAGRALRPLSPIALRAERQPNGDTRLSWVRRSRAGWNWPDGIDAPIGEEREAYRVTRSGADTVELGEAQWLYSAAARAADAAAGRATITIAIVQLGGGGASLPAVITLPTA